MQAVASILPFGKLELNVKLLFYSPDEQRAHRLSARLRHLASVQWEDSGRFSPERWGQRQNDYQLVLLDYAGDTADASTALAHQLGALAPDLPLLGVGSTTTDRAASVLAAWRAGVRGFIDMDATDEDIRHSLDQALKQTESSHPAPASVTRKAAQLVLLLGVRAGVGTSTLAAHLGALSMPRQAANASGDANAHTLLLDMGMPSGDASLYLGAKSDFHVQDALRHAARIDGTLIRSAFPHHASGLTVLSQAQDLPLDIADARPLIERMRGWFELVLCDVGGVSPQHIPTSLLELADEIWLVAEQGIASMVSLDACLRHLGQRRLRDGRLSLIINRYDEACGITAEHMAARFSLPLLAVLPDRGRSLRSSANQGLLLHESAPRDAYVRALAPLLGKWRSDIKGTSDMPRWRRWLHGKGGHPWTTS